MQSFCLSLDNRILLAAFIANVAIFRAVLFYFFLQGSLLHQIFIWSHSSSLYPVLKIEKNNCFRYYFILYFKNIKTN